MAKKVDEFTNESKVKEDYLNVCLFVVSEIIPCVMIDLPRLVPTAEPSTCVARSMPR